MSVEHLTKEDYKDVIESETPAIIDFWAAWCGPCQMMEPVFEEASKECQEKLRFAKVDVEKERELSAAFGISSIPTMVIVHRGKEVARFSGFMPKDALMEKINSTLSGLEG
ncbi:MAG: thioredoxin [Candidatus Micrarchaeota archaeon]